MRLVSNLPPARLRRIRFGVRVALLSLVALVVTPPFGAWVVQAIDPPTATVTGTVFDDRNGNGERDARESGLAGVTVSDGAEIVQTGPEGGYSIEISTDRRLTDLVYITQPAGYKVPTDEFMTPKFYRNLGALADEEQRTADFALVRDQDSRGSNFSFANVADPHVVNNPQDWPPQIRQINSTGREIGFITVSGDLTNNATDAEFQMYRNGTAESDLPVWPAVGNHEYFSGGGTSYAARIDNYRRYVGPEWYSFDYGDRHFLILENNGQAPFSEQFDWVRRDLELNSDGKELVVITHQPMNVPFGSPSQYDAYGDLFEQYQAELILVGHEHSNDVEPNSDFASSAKHIQTVSSSYTIDNAPRGFRYVHMVDEKFSNPFRMYGVDESLTITSPAPGTSVPRAGFPGVQVNAYDTADEVDRVRYRVDGSSWLPLKSSGEFTWSGKLAPNRSGVGQHTIDVIATDDAGNTWTESADFTLTSEPAVQPVAGADWTQHHGDAAHTGTAGALDAGRQLAWSYRTEGTFLTGSPIIVDGVVYAGTRDENGDGNSVVHAVELATGERLWSRPVPSSVTGSLAAGDGKIFVPSLRGSLFAFDARTGQPAWSRDPEAAPAPNNQRAHGYYSPAFADGKVLWAYQTRFGKASQGLITALDPRNGAPIWESPMTGGTMSDGTPAVADGKVFVGNQTADRVIAYDLETGQRQWVGTERLGGWQDGIPVAAGGRVFIGANNGIIARDAATGAELWSYRSPHGSLVSSGATPSAPAVDDGIVYMGFPSGAVTALDARTGAVIWDRLLPGGLYHGGILSSPVVAGDTVFAGSNNGRFYALDRRTGQPLWQHTIGTWVASGPAVSGNTVVTGAWDGNLYAYTGGGEAAQRWANVSGTVSDSQTSGPIDGARVTAVRDGATVATTTTGADGGYVLGLEPGAYTVAVAKRGHLATEQSSTSVQVGSTGDLDRDLSLREVTAPVAGQSQIRPDYGSASTRTDVVAGDSYHYVMNDRMQATIVTRTAANNQPGTFQPGWLADITLTDAAATETVDWSELILAPTMDDPARPWSRSGEWLNLGDVSVDGDSVVAAGTAQVDPDLRTSVRYRALPDSPIVKMTLQVSNTGTEDFDGYFQYLIDPDSSSDVGRVPGVSGTNPGFLTQGWNGNYVYVGANAPNGQPAHGVAWLDDQPSGVTAYGYIDGLWFDASVGAGEQRTISWYHITDYASPGANPAAGIADWASKLGQLDG
jgi:outer membrane protein assembly factor BamB